MIVVGYQLACPDVEEPASPNRNPFTAAHGYFAACSINFKYAGPSTVTTKLDMLAGMLPFLLLSTGLLLFQLTSDLCCATRQGSHEAVFPPKFASPSC